MSGPTPLVPVTPLAGGPPATDRTPAKGADGGPSFASYMSRRDEDDPSASLDDEPARKARAVAAAGAAALPQAPSAGPTVTAFAFGAIGGDDSEPGTGGAGGEATGVGSGAPLLAPGAPRVGRENADAPMGEPLDVLSSEANALGAAPSPGANPSPAPTGTAAQAAPEGDAPSTPAQAAPALPSTPLPQGAVPATPQAHTAPTALRSPARDDGDVAPAKSGPTTSQGTPTSSSAATPSTAAAASNATSAPTPVTAPSDSHAAAPTALGRPSANGDRSVVAAHPRASLESGPGAKGAARPTAPAGAHASKTHAPGDTPATSADAGGDPQVATAANADPGAASPANDASAVKPMAPVTKLAAAPATDPTSAARLREAFASAANHSVLRGAATGEIDVPELGRVAVRARNVGGSVDVDITADRGDVRAALKLHSGAMTNDLRQADVRVGRLTIEQSHSPTPSDATATGRSFDAPARHDRQRPGERDTDEGSAREADEPPTAGGGRVRIVL